MNRQAHSDVITILLSHVFIYVYDANKNRKINNKAIFVLYAEYSKFFTLNCCLKNMQVSKTGNNSYCFVTFTVHVTLRMTKIPWPCLHHTHK